MVFSESDLYCVEKSYYEIDFITRGYPSKACGAATHFRWGGVRPGRTWPASNALTASLMVADHAGRSWAISMQIYDHFRFHRRRPAKIVRRACADWAKEQTWTSAKQNFGAA